MFKHKALVSDFTSLLRQVHCLRTALGVVVRALLVLKEGLVALDGRIDCGNLLIVAITRGLRSDDLRGHMQKEDCLCFLDHDVTVLVELLCIETLFGMFSSLLSLLALGLLILRRFDKRARQAALHRECSGVRLGSRRLSLVSCFLLFLRLRLGFRAGIFLGLLRSRLSVTNTAVSAGLAILSWLLLATIFTVRIQRLWLNIVDLVIDSLAIVIFLCVRDGCSAMRMPRSRAETASCTSG